MIHSKPRLSLIATLILLFSSLSHINAQLTRPPQSGNQKSKICQWMGEVEVCVTYNSPDVTLPSGKSRRGEIWGKLVPYGLYIQTWLEVEGEAPIPKPWRAGANETSVITFSHDVLIEDKSIKAGSYGLFFIAGEKEWELILSNDVNTWGAYFYDEKNDALRVKLTPEKAEYREYLTFDFVTKKLESTTVALWWEDLKVPFHVSVVDVHKVYLDKMKEELSSKKMHDWYNWQEAAQYCLDNNVELEQGLYWAEKAINQGWIGSANFLTLKTKAGLLTALNRTQEADSLMEFAVKNLAGVFELHNYGRELLAKNKPEEAMKIFKTNAEKHPNYWVSQLGLARGYAAIGNTKLALKYAKQAKKIIPKKEQGVRQYAVNLLIEQLEKKETPIVYLAPGWVQVY